MAVIEEKASQRTSITNGNITTATTSPMDVAVRGMSHSVSDGHLFLSSLCLLCEMHLGS